MPAWRSTCRISTTPAPPASACSAPNCNSWWRRAFRASGEQYALYRAVLDAAGDKPVTFRTLDIGGDKVLPYMDAMIEEENPALGWRAIRLGLDRPGLLRDAIARLAARRRQPGAADHVSDDLDSRRIRRRQGDRRARTDAFAPPRPQVAGRVEVGSMVEVPSLLYQLDELLERSTFSRSARTIWCSSSSRSIAAIPRVRAASTPCRAPVLRALKDIVDKARAVRTSRRRSAASLRRSRSARWRWSRSAIVRCR